MNLEVFVAALDEWADQRIKRPVALTAVRWGISATTLNFLGLAGCMVSAFLIALEDLVAGGVIFFVASGLDAFDGSVARATGRDKAFALGGWLDAYLGFVGEGAVLVSLMWLSTESSHSRIVVFAIVITMMVSHAKSVAAEYSIYPDWREVRLVGRGIRITMLSAGLIASGFVARDRAVLFLDITLIALIVVNAFVLYYRVRKIVIRARVLDD